MTTVPVPALEAVAEWLRSQPVALSFALLVGASLAAGWLVTALGLPAVRRLVGRTENRIDDALFEELRVPVSATVSLAGVYLAGTWLALADGDGFLLVAGTLSVLVVVWARGLVRLGRRVVTELDERSAAMEVAPIFENLWAFVVLVGSVFALLSLWRVDITPLLASAGIVGIAVGFAARDTIANFFGSLALYADDTYRVGDYVVLDSGEAGTVIDVTIRSTRLITRDNVVVTVPNAVLNSARITNQSAPRPHKRVRVPVGVAYGTDLDDAEAALLGVADEVDLVVDAPEPRVRFRGFGDSALDLELLAWVETPMRDSRAVHELNRGIYERFADDGIEIPFPRRVVTVAGESGADAAAGVAPRGDGAPAGIARDARDAQNESSDS